MNTTLNDANFNEGEPPLNLIAAQYVLGTLSASARLRFQSRLQQEPDLRALTHAWERRLNPLTHLLVPQAVPAEVWQKIEARLDGLAANTGQKPVSLLSQQPPSLPEQSSPKTSANDRFWQPWAWFSSAVAAGLALFIFVRPEVVPPMQTPIVAQAPVSHDVAVLSTDKNSPAWIVRKQGNALVLNALNAQAVPSDRDLELWSIKGSAAPRSLGVIHVKDGQATIPQVTADLIAHDVTLAISLEPKNGSPTGQPTGAVLYTGKVVQG